MADSLFDIFGDHITRQAVKNVSRQPLYNVENIGKTIGKTVTKSNIPVKTNEPTKKLAESKKSFLSNKGKALQNTPLKQAFTPQAVNVGSLIYSDNDNKVDAHMLEEIEFTKPKYSDFQQDALDFLPLPQIELDISLPSDTPPPRTREPQLELECSFGSDFYSDGITYYDEYFDSDLNLPDIY